MKKIITILYIFIALMSCRKENQNLKMLLATDEVPKDIPIDFKYGLIPENKLIHKGAFSPNLQEYYYTISDKNFDNFDVHVIKKLEKGWSEPEKAFFDSDHNEHGMSFSPDGKVLYFSSTRPVGIEKVLSTWHIWKSEKVNGKWTSPTFVDIPNLRDKLVSHPVMTNNGNLFFHVSNLDYSEMDIYYSKEEGSHFRDAEKVSFSNIEDQRKCTPYVSPNEDFLIYAAIGSQLDLYISFNDGKGNWGEPKKLNDRINDSGQGNPYVTPDNKYLFFTIGKHEDKNWKVKWVNIENELR
ncbi:TolB family protein [Tenacibaculum xiamenense]|uniref:TolB family protein n=1 Tax=Tenacibaculum xiamenense TaxID=1261553 RepID=UPI0038939E15